MADSVKLQYDPSPTFVHPFRLTVPGRDTPAVLRLIVKRKTEEELAALMASTLSPSAAAKIIQGLQVALGAEDLAVVATVLSMIERHAKGVSLRAFVSEVVVGWPEGPEDEKGASVPWSPEALQNIMSIYLASAGEITGQYIEALVRSRIKN